MKNYLLEVGTENLPVSFQTSAEIQLKEAVAKKCNINVDQLKIQKYDDIEYIVAIVEQKGKKVEEILPEILPELVLSLRGSHFMRWEDLDVRFQRPIRWIASMLDNESLPVTIADVISTKSSHGHRFLSPDPVDIPSPKDYKDT